MEKMNIYVIFIKLIKYFKYLSYIQSRINKKILKNFR